MDIVCVTGLWSASEWSKCATMVEQENSTGGTALTMPSKSCKISSVDSGSASIRLARLTLQRSFTASFLDWNYLESCISSTLDVPASYSVNSQNSTIWQVFSAKKNVVYNEAVRSMSSWHHKALRETTRNGSSKCPTPFPLSRAGRDEARNCPRIGQSQRPHAFGNFTRPSPSISPDISPIHGLIQGKAMPTTGAKVSTFPHWLECLSRCKWCVS